MALPALTLPVSANLIKLLFKFFGVAVIVALYSGAMFYLGHQYKTNDLQAEQNDELRKRLAQVTARWSDSNDLVRDLEAHIRADVKKIDTLQEQIDAYVPETQNDQCGPSVGIIGLLNNARDPGLPPAAVLPDDQGQAPSGVDYTEQVQDTLEITERYNALMLRHNKLVQWLEEHQGDQSITDKD